VAAAGRLSWALAYLDLLRCEGFWFQAYILNCWIHRFQRGDFNDDGKQEAEVSALDYLQLFYGGD
jgi:hypothetical protein